MHFVNQCRQPRPDTVRSVEGATLPADEAAATFPLRHSDPFTPSVFQHEAMLYRGEEGFVEGIVPFLLEALAGGAPALVVVSAAKIEALRHELGEDADDVDFADMAEVGVNPARIIPLWQRFVERHRRPGRVVHGVGEPIWAARTAAELAECQRHERLLNLAFDRNQDFRLVCPYDLESLDEAVIEEALRSHPYLDEGGAPVPSADFSGTPAPTAAHTDPLPPAPPGATEMPFDGGSLDEARHFVAEHPLVAALAGGRAPDLVLAVNEVMTNSVQHGGGLGRVRLWREGDSLVCEVRDSGRIHVALAGRVAPAIESPEGRGLWMANQLCDLVQIRSFPGESVVRLHVRAVGAG